MSLARNHMYDDLGEIEKKLKDDKTDVTIADVVKLLCLLCKMVVDIRSNTNTGQRKRRKNFRSKSQGKSEGISTKLNIPEDKTKTE